MAKKKQAPERVVLVERQNDETEPEIPVDVDELRAIAELEGNSDVKWRVERTTNPMGFCGVLSSAEVSFERIQELWGKGTYRVRGTRANGQFVAQRTFVVIEESQTAVKPAVAAPAAPASQATTTQDLILLLDQREAARSDNMLKWGAILAPLFAPLIANLTGGSKGPSLTDLTTALSNIKQVADPGSKSQMKEFVEMMNLVKTMSGESDEPWWAGPIKDVAGAVAPAIAMARSGGPAAPSGAAAPVTQQNQQVKQEQPDVNMQLMLWVKGQVEGLVYQAARNKDPEFYADFVCDNLPDGADPAALHAFLMRTDWWQQLQTFVPPTRQHGEWFAECRKRLLENLAALMNPPAGGAS